MHDDDPLDPAGRLGSAYYELALALLALPASVDARDLTNLPSLIANAPNAVATAASRHLSLDELRTRLDGLTIGDRVALIVDAERRSVR